MANPTTGGKIPMRDIPSSLSPDETVAQLKTIVQSVLQEIVAALAPFVHAGLAKALSISNRAEAELKAVAVTDKASLPLYVTEMYNLLSELYEDDGSTFPVLETGPQLDYAKKLIDPTNWQSPPTVPIVAPPVGKTPVKSPQKVVPKTVTPVVQPPKPKPVVTPSPSPPPPVPPPIPSKDYPVKSIGPWPTTGPPPMNCVMPLKVTSTTVTCPTGLIPVAGGKNADGSIIWLCCPPQATVTPKPPPPPSPPPPPTVQPPPIQSVNPPPINIPSPPPLIPGPPPPIVPPPNNSPPPPPPPPVPPPPPPPPMSPEVESTCPPCLVSYLNSLQSYQVSVNSALALAITSIQNPTPVNITVNTPQYEQPVVNVSTEPPSVITQLTEQFSNGHTPTKFKTTAKGPLPETPVTPTVGSVNIPNFNSIEVCGNYHVWGDQPKSKQAKELIDWLGKLPQGGDSTGLLNDLLASVAKIPVIGTTLAPALRDTVELFGGLPQIIAKIGNYLGSEIGCHTGDAIVPIVAESLIGFASKYVSSDFSDYAIPFQQWRRAICPTELPSIADANGAYLANEISEDLWECWVRANNGLPVPNRIVRDSARARLSRDEYISLLLRKAITPDEFAQKVRELGYTEASDVNGMQTLANALPGVGDIIRFLVRDVGDNRIVDTFGLDESFANKWSQDLSALAKSQGISDDLAKLYWRAHWDIPSPTQLYTMLHRLRPGRVPGLDTTKLRRPITPAEQKSRLDPKDIVTTIADVQLALQQDDVAPFWQNRLLAVSYRNLTRTDVKMAYQNSAIDRAEMVESLQDYGLNAERAEVLSKIYDEAKVRYVLRLPEVVFYIKGTLSKEEITLFLKSLNTEQGIIDTVLRRAELRSKANFRGACLKATLDQYYKGEIGEIELRAQIRKLGLTLEHANRIIENALCEAKHKSKDISVTQIGQLFYDGLLGYAEVIVRLVRIGYKQTAATLLAQDLLKRREARDLLAEERKTRKEEAADKRHKKEMDRIEKDENKKAKAAGKAEPPEPLTVPPPPPVTP